MGTLLESVVVRSGSAGRAAPAEHVVDGAGWGSCDEQTEALLDDYHCPCDTNPGI